MTAIREHTMRTERRILLPRRTAAATGLAALLLLAAGCGAGGAPGAGGAGASKDPHAALSSGLACPGTDAHTTHLNIFGCDVCHEANGGRFLFTKTFTFPRGTSTAGGQVVPGSGTTPTSCTVACHYPMGAAPHAITWDTPGPLDCTACHDTTLLPATHPAVAANAPRATCTACHTMTGHMDGVVQASGHDPSWMDTTSTGFHAYSANQGLAACESCHGTTLSGQGTTPGCGSCHDQTSATGTTVPWNTNCVMCHGGTDDASGAPPRTTWGNGADPLRVGAHTAHARGGALAPAYDCAVCHVKPQDAFTTGHIDGPTATLTFSGMAVRGVTPTWDRTTGTCTNVYCHGSTVAGGTNKTPAWTAGAGQATCGTCHGAPPPAPHPAAASLTACVACHPTTVAADGTVIPPAQGGTHLDGVLQSNGGHPASWMDQTSPGFHAYAADTNLAACQGCHGPKLDGVGGSATTACASCHGASWTTNCTMCHGGVDNATGAPPKATWGNGADAIRVGAHSRHVGGSANAPAVPCASCHVVPADALAAGHVAGSTATVTFGGVAATSGAAPTWTRGTASCATTYCHGGYQGTFTYQSYDWGTGLTVPVTVSYRGAGATPSWTGGPMTCSSCHGAPPANGQWHDPGHGGPGGNACSLCHPGVNAAGTGFTDPTRHVDGTVDVTPAWTSACFNCH